MKIVLISTDETTTAAIGVRALSSCLIENGHDTSVVLMPTYEDGFKSFHWKDLEDICKDAGLIGISFMTHGMKKAIEVKRVLEKLSTPIIAGGVHACLDPESLINDFHLVCHGEGEDLIIELADLIADGKPYYDISGLWVRTNEGVNNSPVPLKKDLEGYPFPDYDLSHQYILEDNRLVKMNMIHIPVLTFIVLGSRGCPHSCTYCSNNKLGKEFPWRRSVRHYSVDYLIRHMKEIIKSYPQIRSFWIEDDTFFAKSMADIKEFCYRYKNEITKPFMIDISPWTYDEEKMKSMADAGMNKFILGVQSGSENTNKNIYKRNSTNKKLFEIIWSIHKIGIKGMYDFIGVNPFETETDLTETIRFIRKMPPPFQISNNKLAFYPGTELYNVAIKEGIDVLSRIKHSEAELGYKILINETIRNKALHFVLLLMSGHANKFIIGKMPRLLLTDYLIIFYCFVPDTFIVWMCKLMLLLQFKKKLMKLIGARRTAIIKSGLLKLTSQRTQ